MKWPISLTDKRTVSRRIVRTPTIYDVLASVQKCDIGTHEQFCADMGIDTDSIRGSNLYFAVQKEYQEFSELCAGVPGMLEEAREIQ